jgi:predicted Na+-dependent transporter
MKSLVPLAVFLLMVSVGMSLDLRALVENWRRLTWPEWLRLLLSTFVIPAATALLLCRLLGLDKASLAGLFMVGVAPGAPLLTRNAAKRGFDLQLAASYQVWCALLVPVMVPLLVALAGTLYHREIWIEPAALLRQIAVQQFLPLGLGVALVAWLPRFAARIHDPVVKVGSLLLTVMVVVFLWKLGPVLLHVNPLIFLAAAGVAASALGSMLILGARNRSTNLTLALCNTNRHVGLALLMAGQYLHIRSALPAIAAYALSAVVVMTIYARQIRPAEKPVLA